MGGAMILGKRMFETIDSPSGWVFPDRTAFTWPVFVLTHEVREPVTKGQTPFTFVNDGIESALALARAAAGDKNIGVAGANVAQQFIRAGLLDEISIHHSSRSGLPGWWRPALRSPWNLATGARIHGREAGRRVTHLKFRFKQGRDND